LCTSNKKQTLFEFFLQFFKSLERTLSSSFELSQCLKVEAGALHKKNHVFFFHLAFLEGLFSQRKKERKKIAQLKPGPRGTFPTSLSHNVAKRGHGASFSTQEPRVKHMRE